MPERFRRFDSPLAADQQLIDATLSILIAEGPDAISLSQLALLLDRDSEELLELFGHPGELLAQLWQTVLRQQLIDITDLAQRIFGGDLAAIEDIRVNVSLRRAALQLCVVAHRYDELAEVVPADLTQQVTALCSRIAASNNSLDANTQAADRSVVLGLLGWVMGILLEPVDIETSSLQSLALNDFHHRCWTVDVDSVAVERQPPQVLIYDQSGPLSGELLRASTNIVAQGGVGRATLSRVARMSGFPPEVVVGMYINQENLIADFIETMVSTLFSYETVSGVINDPPRGAMRLSVWLEDGLRTRRRALLEIVLAGAHSSSISAAYAQAVRQVDSFAKSIPDQRLANSEIGFSMYAAMVRHICLGLAVLQNLVGDFQGTDWRPFTSMIFAAEKHSSR